MHSSCVILARASDNHIFCLLGDRQRLHAHCHSVCVPHAQVGFDETFQKSSQVRDKTRTTTETSSDRRQRKLHWKQRQQQLKALQDTTDSGDVWTTASTKTDLLQTDKTSKQHCVSSDRKGASHISEMSHSMVSLCAMAAASALKLGTDHNSKSVESEHPIFPARRVRSTDADSIGPCFVDNIEQHIFGCPFVDFVQKCVTHQISSLDFVIAMDSASACLLTGKILSTM